MRIYEIGALVISSFALAVSVASVVFSILAWRQANRPIVVAKVRTAGSGNLATALELLVTNVGNRPAADVHLNCRREDLLAAMMPDVTGVLRDQIIGCFSANSMIPVLENGASVSGAFGLLSKVADSTWKLRARLPVVLEYRDLGGRRFCGSVTLLLAGDETFTGFKWSPSERKG